MTDTADRLVAGNQLCDANGFQIPFPSSSLHYLLICFSCSRPPAFCRVRRTSETEALSPFIQSNKCFARLITGTIALALGLWYEVKKSLGKTIGSY